MTYAGQDLTFRQAVGFNAMRVGCLAYCGAWVAFLRWVS
jgi:hypothetical protein